MKWILVIFLLTVWTTAQTAPKGWSLIAEGARDGKVNVRYYVQNEAPIKAAPGVVKFWLQSSGLNGEIWGPDFERVLHFVDCQQKKDRTTEIVAYNKDGKIDAKRTGKSLNSDWFEIIPDTAMETIADKMCQKAILDGVPKRDG